MLRIYGPVVQQGKWRIRSLQELRELCEDLDIVSDVTKKRWEWTENVARPIPVESRIREDLE